MKELRKNFCVFILSHGRADNVQTLDTLRKKRYTGAWYIVIDDMDSAQEAYKQKYGEHVVIFNKAEAALEVDTADNFDDMRAVVFARNKLWDIAKKLGYDYFLVLDDDYSSIEWRFEKDNGTKLGFQPLQDCDSAFEIMLTFLDDTGADCVAFAQGGDFIGGVTSKKWKKKIHRKIMNSFFCSTKKRFKFSGRTNEDTTAYVDGGVRGKLFFSIVDLSIHQQQTQANKGGLTDIYLRYGTYVKSFYSVIFQPSAVKVKMMQTDHTRIHHSVSWNNCTPLIISDRWKKK